MPDYGKFKDDVLVEEITFTRKFVPVGGRKASNHSPQWMKKHGYVPYIKPTVLDGEYEGVENIPTKENSVIVSYTHAIKTKDYSTIRAEITSAIESKAYALVSSVNSSIIDTAAKTKVNDLVSSKCKGLLLELAETTDINLKYFDYTSTWDGIEDFGTIDLTESTWTKLKRYMFGV